MTQAKVNIRLARIDEAARIASMSLELIETGLGWSWTPERVARSIADRDTITLAACCHGRVVGFAIMYFGDEHAHLNLIAVQPRSQRAGIGRMLMAWLEESALAAGIAVIRLELREKNEAARLFYERLGYGVIGRVPLYYRGLETAIRMARDIRRGEVISPNDHIAPWERW
jgi:ribosomal-protein-alanine N-acetyltransferase